MNNQCISFQLIFLYLRVYLYIRRDCRKLFEFLCNYLNYEQNHVKRLFVYNNVYIPDFLVFFNICFVVFCVYFVKLFWINEV